MENYLEDYPDVESVSCFLGTTATLALLLCDKCLRASDESVMTAETLATLHTINSKAYALVCDYSFISDSVRILDDRIREAVKMLDAITSRELAEKKVNHEAQAQA